MKRQKGMTTPYEEMTGHHADLRRAVTWGCEGWALIRRKKKDKLSTRAERCVHLGVSLEKKEWRVLFWRSRKIIDSRNVVFFEGEFPFLTDTDSTARERNAEQILRERSVLFDHHDAEDRQETCDRGEDRHGAAVAQEDVDDDDNVTIDCDDDEDESGEALNDDQADSDGDGSADRDSIADQGGDDDNGGSALRRSTKFRWCPDRWAPNSAYYAFRIRSRIHGDE